MKKIKRTQKDEFRSACTLSDFPTPMACGMHAQRVYA